ncbi:MAG: dihydroneopterin aldolase [Flavobacteriaceae bacterium]|nr:dihydroneopterin aldolase [Flavobacteriaceae bacterium]
MSTIELSDIKLFAFHGCLVEEEKIGSEYIVNLSVEADLEKAASTDELSDTVDYVLLHHIVKEEMAIRSKLLEHVGRRIIDRVLREAPEVDEVRVSVSKVNPPIGGDVKEVRVMMRSKR